jgi:hypothetical protein
MSLSPQKVDFEKIWNGLQEGVANIITLTGVKGMPMIEYAPPPKTINNERRIDVVSIPPQGHL